MPISFIGKDGLMPQGDPNVRVFKPNISVYQRIGRDSIGSYGDYNIGKYALMPTYNYNPTIGIPRLINTDMLRRLGDTIWIGMCKKVISIEVSNSKPTVVSKEGFTASQERIDGIQKFIDKPNTNGESISDLLYKWCDDFLTIGDAIFVKVFYDNIKVEKSIDFKFIKYNFNEDDKPGVHVLKSHDAKMKKLITYVPEKFSKTETAPNNLFELWVPDASTFLINADIEGKLPEDNIPAYWQYNYMTTGTSTIGPRPFFKREIIWIKNNPRADMVYGWSPILDCLPQVECLQGGTRFNQKFFENMCRPDGIISLEGADPTTCDEATNLWKDKFNNNPHKILFVGQKHTYTPLNINNQEMEWLEGQQYYQKLVMSIFHVTSDELGFSEDSNRLTGPHQSRVFIRKAILPILSKLEHAFNNQVIPEFYNEGEEVDVEVKFDFDDEAQTQMELDTQLKKLNAGLITPNEARLEMGLEETEWGDEPKRSGGGSNLMNPQDNYAKKENDQFNKDLSVSQLILKKKFDILDTDRLEEFFTKYFGLLKSETLKLFEKFSNHLTDFVRAVKSLFTLNLNEDKLYKIFKEEYSRGAESVEKQLDVNVNLPSENSNIAELAKAMNDGYLMSDGTRWYGIKGTNEKLAEEIRKSLAEGVDKGEGIKKLRDRVVDLMDTTESRATMIARTEAKRINNIGKLDAAIMSDLPLKKRWHAVHDNVTGDDSLRLDKQVRALTEEFVDKVGGWHGQLPPHRPGDRCIVQFFTADM